MKQLNLIFTFFVIGVLFISLSPDSRNYDDITKLDLSKKGLTKIPDEVFKMVNLKELILYKNQLEELPAEIGKLKNLEKLVVSYNKLKKLPPES